MKNYILLPGFLFLLLTVHAQKQIPESIGVISGKVIDMFSKTPIEYAAITVYSKGNKKPVNGSITNSKGVFKLDGLALGEYDIIVDFLGYKSKKLDSVIVTSENPNISLGTISLLNTSETLANVTVTTSHPIIENKIDKLIYNVDKDITSQGGMATDVLRKVPQVFVDVDGNVELQGSSSIRFLINGKPSTMFGNSVADALQSIPASQIQSIEVITSPGAKYDAQGTGGIINIILKKSNIRGMNGNINLSGGTRLENGSLNMNYRHNKFGMNAYFSGNAQLNSTTINSLNRASSESLYNTSSMLLQSGSSSFARNGYHTGLGFDWDISKTDNISGNLGYHEFNNNDHGITYQEAIIHDFSGNKLSDSSTIRNSKNNFSHGGIDWGLNYKKLFKKDKRELDISYHSSNGRDHSYYFQSQNYPASSIPFAGSSSNNPGVSNESELSIDYTHPVNENMVIETGAKYGHDKYTSVADVFTLNNNSKTYLLDPVQSYALNYNRDIYAYYLSTTFSLFKFFDMKAGGRYEYTVSKADFSNAHNVSIPSYYIFAPSFIISHSFSNGQSLKLSYTHRIERPDYRDLNPFINLSDPHNISTGNPQLRPELGNNFELGYNHSFQKESNINISVFYRKNTDDISSFTTFYPAYQIGDSIYKDVSVTQRQNINSDERFGINLSGSLSVNDKVTLRTNIFTFEHRINTTLNGGSNNNGYGYRMNINGTYIFDKNLAFEFFGNFRSKETNAQGTQTSFISYNMAMRKYFLNKKLSLGLTTTNPFSKYVNQTRITFGSNFQQTSIRQIPFRSFGINLMYKFGKLEFKKLKEEDLNNQNAPF